jgi:hypothetical protein
MFRLWLIKFVCTEAESCVLLQSFVVVSDRFGTAVIHRFSATPSFYILSPWNPVRRAAIAVHVNQYFDLLIILCILVNCIFLALPNYSWLQYTEYVRCFTLG